MRTLFINENSVPHGVGEISGSELGHSGMGVVYLARQKSLNRRVAMKVLRPGERTFGPMVTRFLDEARHLAQLRHPNIVAIHEVGDVADEPYFTMDFIDGETLSTVIARGPLTPTQAVEVLKQVAAGVQHAHQHCIIHRDLKPGNVLLDQRDQVTSKRSASRHCRNPPPRGSRTSARFSKTCDVSKQANRCSRAGRAS